MDKGWLNLALGNTKQRLKVLKTELFLCRECRSKTYEIYKSYFFFQDHARELRNSRIQQNKLYYTRKDYSKSEKKVKRDKEYLAELREELLEKKGALAMTNAQVSKQCAENLLQKAFLLEERMTHQRLCAEREEHTKIVEFAQLLTYKIGGERDSKKSRIRLYFERVFGLQDSRQTRISKDISSVILTGGCKDDENVNNTEFRSEAVDVLKEIKPSSGKISRLARFFKKKNPSTDKLIGNAIQKLSI